MCLSACVTDFFFQFMKVRVQFNQNYKFSSMEAEELE